MKVAGDGGGCAQRVSAYVMGSGAGRKLIRTEAHLGKIDVMVRPVKIGPDCTEKWCFSGTHFYAYLRIAEDLIDCDRYYSDYYEDARDLCFTEAGKQAVSARRMCA